MSRKYRLTLWMNNQDNNPGALRIDIEATSPGRAIDNALDKYRLPKTAVIGWDEIIKKGVPNG